MPYIRDYQRADGTHVRGHYRWAAGARHEMALLTVTAMLIVGIGNGSTSAATGGQQAPRSQKPTTYPIRFNDSGQGVESRPEKPVTYPIRFPKVDRKPAPRGSVSYPVHFTTNGSGR